MREIVSVCREHAGNTSLSLCAFMVRRLSLCKKNVIYLRLSSEYIKFASSADSCSFYRYGADNNDITL